MSRMKDGSRKVIEIAELAGVQNGTIETNSLYQINIGMTGNKLLHREKLEASGRNNIESTGEKEINDKRLFEI